MSDRDLSAEDVAAMRREGYLKKFLRDDIHGGQAKFRAGQRRPGPVLRTGTAHIPGAWPVPASDGDPSRVVCACPDCTALQADRPPLEELLRDDDNERPESA